MNRRILAVIAMAFLGLILILLFSDALIMQNTSLDWRAAEKEEEQENARRPDKPDQAALEEILLRSQIGKKFSYPPNWRFNAFRQVKQQYQLLKVNDDLKWIERGPSDVAGRARAIVVHPQKTNSWWVASVGGGIWFTEDGGQSWACQTDEMPVLSVSTIAICDSQPDILYAGTGEGFFNYDAIIGDGIFKTTNGGINWVQLSSTISDYDFRFVNRIVVHPRYPDTLLAATKTGVMRSLDGGQTWQKVFDIGSSVQQIVCNPLNFNSLFITVWKAGIYKSVDMGQNWYCVSDSIKNATRIELAISAIDTNYVYAAAADTSYALLGLFKSNDGGRTWNNLGNAVNWLYHQGWYNNTLLVHPFNPHIVFVGGIDLYKVETQNNGFNSERLSSWYISNVYPYVHADQHCIAAITHPDSTFELVVTNDGGVFYSNNGGISWQSRNTGLNITQFYDADRNPNANQYIGGTQDNGTLVSPKNPSRTSEWIKKIDGDGFDCAWDDQNADIVYGTLYNSIIYKSITQGEYFKEKNNGLPESRIFHTPLAMDPHNTNKLITASDTNRIFISYNGAESWHPVDVNLGGYKWIRLAISEKDSNIVWAASSSFYINVSTDGGKSFQIVSNPDQSLNAYLTGIATSPFDSATALAMFGVYGYGKIFRTRNLGQSWEDITSNLPEVPVHCALFMPYDSSQIWIGTDIGVFVSYNGGQSWSYFDRNMPAVAVRSMKIVGSQIVAATHGRGVWTLDNDTLRTYNLPVKEPLLAELPLPNPNTDSLKISFFTQGAYDSLKVLVNDVPEATLFNLKAYADTFAYCQVQRPAVSQIYLKGYKDNVVYVSRTESIETFEALDSLYFNFEDGINPFKGNFLVSVDEGFSVATLHTEHPYANSREHIALLPNPIVVSDSMRLSYSDIAVVEPGDEGYYYPYPQMWDYVTVEGSDDGLSWKNLIEPYDARWNEEWLSAFREKRAPAPDAFMKHDTLLSAMYDAGTRIYLRFRLHADAATNGWGWAINELWVGENYPTGLAAAESPAYQFQLLGNYPNPFNASTLIKFSLAKQEAVTLIIYNALGQKVRTLLHRKVLPPGAAHQVMWNGLNDLGQPVGSGVYFCKIISGKFVDVRKMVVLK
ncbi:T9SS type A sorting domain-containing protein [Calditrichota bacterium LG25]